MARPERDVQASVLELLRGMRGLDPLKDLFWSQLNYEHVNTPLPRRGWPQRATEALAEDPVLFAAGGAGEAFQVIYARLNANCLYLTHERPVVGQLLRQHPYSLFVFSTANQDYWHFINVKQADDPAKRRIFRRITVGQHEKLRTASERIAMLDLESVRKDMFGLAPLDIQKRHDQAFDVEAVTEQFFQDYKGVFDELQRDLGRQAKDKPWAHDYALQFLNRCMFLYFVQRKGWLAGDGDFLANFWQAYKDRKQPEGSRDSFFDKWLSVLFFEAFNDRYRGGHRQFPQPIDQALSMAPYLNGGLFKSNELDDRDKHDFAVTDARFGQVFTFLEQYNFTIAEDSPLDQEVAVDPEMIGKVYESLVNVSEEADERGDAGIFYTPRTEIDLMCRLALVDNLANHLGEQHKNLLYELVFALEPDEKEAADAAVAKAGLWPAVNDRLRAVKVVDPACGSASFLVGMLRILDDLQVRAAEQLRQRESAYDRKKRIIGQNLYGVDVMDWACHVAELRLWLALIIDVQMTREELHVRRDPLLPHFSFNIRCGDSLVQEVGGVNLGHRRGNMEIPRPVKDRLRRLQNAKLAFYNNQPDERLRTETAIRNEELAIFRDLLGERASVLAEEAKGLMRVQVAAPHRQMTLDGGQESSARQLTLDREAREAQIARLMEEAQTLKDQRDALRHAGDLPVVWDIAFAEVMDSEADGFDIVVGNPPYVRQESIAAPFVNGRQITEDKREYKDKLARSVYQAWHWFFGYSCTAVGETVRHKLDAKSDLYIYFYFLGLSLLNDKGSFCFITSNSWLDVGYGSDLQEFLLKHAHVKLVLDNQVERSFASADVNTAIVLFDHPDDRSEAGLSRTARFVMFKAPFEQIVSPVVFEEIASSDSRRSTPEFRVCPIAQSQLLQDGCSLKGACEPSELATKKARQLGSLIKVTQYTGDKWGGKYLRLPDIYWTVMEKGKGRFVRIGELCDIQRGFSSGANDFFYLDETTAKDWCIEKRFLKPAILRPAEIITPEIALSHISQQIFVADESRESLRGTNAEKYIRWGEKQGFHKSATCLARGRAGGEWYRLRPRPPAALVLPIINKMRLVLGINAVQAQVADNCVEMRPRDDANIELIAALMLGSFNFLIRHAEGRSYGRMLKIQTFEAARLSLLDPSRLSRDSAKRLVHAFRGIRSHQFAWLVKDVETPQRQAFDREWLALHGIEKEREQTLAMNGIYGAVRKICEDMNAQEETWIKSKAAARAGGNPQDFMKGKRGNGRHDEEDG